MSKEVRFLSSHARVPQKELTSVYPLLEKERQALINIQSTYQEPRGAINLPLDRKMQVQVKKLVQDVGTVDLLVVVGIGGSNLGTMAVQQLVQGMLHNELTDQTRVLYLDTVDADKSTQLLQSVEHALHQDKKVVLVIVSKSGTTTETIANAELLIALLAEHTSTYAHHIVTITDKDSLLDKHAEKHKFHRIHIPKQIGGRYSILSPAGLVPLALAGIDIDELTKGATAMRTQALKPLKSNPVVHSAAIKYYHALHGQTIQDLFLFGNDFEPLGKWYRQLVAESLGKGCDTEGKSCIGVTPTYSIGTADMHSIAQLYLGGPFDKLTTFVHVEKNHTNPKLPLLPKYNALVKNIQGKSVQSIMDAIYRGVTHTFKEKKRPFTQIILPDKSPYSIGQFLQFHMMEVMYLARLFNINPFDQPDIEAYKKETRRLLTN